MWKTVKLGEIASWVRGLTYSKKDEVDDGGIAVLRATNIDLATHKIVLDEVRLVSDSVKVKDDKYAQVGDLLVCTASGSKSHVGKVAIVEDDLGMAFGGFMAAIRCNEDCYPRFLYHVLTSQKFKWHLNNLGDGANINNLKFSQIEEYELPLPPLAEQQRIVAKLDAAFAEIDRAVELAQDALDNGSHLREKTFEALFAKIGEQYGVMQLGDGIKLISGQHIAAKDYNLDGVGMGYLTGPSDFGNINPSVTKFTTSPKKTAQQGDVLVTIKGSGIGKANIMVEQELAISRQLAAIRPVAFTSEFVFAFVETQFEKLQKLGNGAAIPGLSRGDIEKLQIPSPPLDVQDGILEHAMSSDSQVEIYEQCQIEKLKNLYQLKSAILAQELQPPQSEAA